jgi:hypothetical protein
MYMGQQLPRAEMHKFGKRAANRRASTRESLVLPGLLSMLATSRSVVLEDVSCAGAKFRSAEAPDLGKDVLIRIGEFVALGKVVWRNGDGCGVEFDEEIGERELEGLRVDDISSSLAHLSGDERVAAQEWISGFAR